MKEFPLSQHPGVTALLRYFAYDHLSPRLAVVSGSCHALAHDMAGRLPQGPELTAGLRKLLEAKDCFVRAALDEAKEER
jgi:hypothetical protein